MKLAKIISLLGVLAMTAVLIYGFTVGDFSGEGSQLLSMPWGIVSLVDLYTGFVLFSGWIIYREKSLPAFTQMMISQTDKASSQWQNGETVDMLVESRKIAMPLVVPNIKRMRTKKSWLDKPSAAMDASPNCPTMMTSIMLREALINC